MRLVYNAHSNMENNRTNYVSKKQLKLSAKQGKLII